MPISEQEAEMMLQSDLIRTILEAYQHIPRFADLSIQRQAALVDMLFNLGLTRFLKFKRMLAALESLNYELAAKEMLDSKWARQVKGRANELSEKVKIG